MDPIARRSAVLATVIHASLVALAFLPHGCSEVPEPTAPPLPPSAAQPPPPLENVKPTSPVYGALVAAPLSASAALSGNATPLPALGANDLPPLPEIVRIVPAVRQDHAGKDVSRGDKQGKDGSPIDLPTLPATPDDLISRLQKHAVSNEALSREQRMLATAQEFLHGRLQGQIERRWRHLLKEVVETRLVVEIRVDSRGRLTYAHLVNSSGSLALDRLISEWLKSPDVNLPPITPEIVYPFLITIRR